MNKRDTLIALAERCERAVVYDGRLMAEIDCAVRFPDLRPAEPDDHPTVKGRTFDPSSIWTTTGWLMSRNYFRSLDDAISLVPEGAEISVSTCKPGILGYVRGPYAVVGFFREPDPRGVGLAATLPLALTAAALRALASREEENG